MGRHDILMPRATRFARDELGGTYTEWEHTIVYSGSGQRDLPHTRGQAGAPGPRQSVPGDPPSGATGQ